ncbi:MAG: hypothetical protein LBU72_01520 [Burkholderiaceae bacterium]|nr:hypothetical protein [Burkholderiaceae bacterium]
MPDPAFRLFYRLRLLAVVLLWIVFLPAAWAQGTQDAAGHGYLDLARVDPQTRTLDVQGWAVPGRPSVSIVNAIIEVANQRIYRGRMVITSRPDVVASGRADWSDCGFRVQVRLPDDLPAGAQPILVRMRQSDGAEFTLDPAPTAQNVDVPPLDRPSRRARAVILIALALPVLALVWGPWHARRRKVPDRTGRWFGAALVLSFVLLVASGATGSSQALLWNASPVVVQDMHAWLGLPREIRSDEWEDFTPLALAQRAADPPWPVRNDLLGADGQNALIPGMTGMPVWHLSALARPATWGFLCLDLRRALAWLWWLPIMGAWGAVALLWRRLFGLDWRTCATRAACVALAPYSAVYSFWPAYLTLFGAVGLVACHRALRATRWRSAAGAGFIAGWAAAGFALFLYPPWQISVATLLALLLAGWVWRDRAELHWHMPQWLALAVALLVLLALMGTWWQDAHQAVAVIRDTVYPGRRHTEAGGGAEAWFWLRGWLAPVLMYVQSPYTCASDAGSFVLLPIAVSMAVLTAWQQRRRVDALSGALMLFSMFAVTFMFAGFPHELTAITGWNRVTDYRLDLALGLVQAGLIGWLLSTGAAPIPPSVRWLRPFVIGVMLLTALHAAWQWRALPAPLADAVSPALAVIGLAALMALTWLLLMQRRTAFLTLFALWTLAPALPFNPLAQAPAHLALAPDLKAAGIADVQADASKPDGARKGVAVIERDWAMSLPAVGVPVSNSVFYAPEQSLWKSLDPTGAQRTIYNRYQWLLFELAQPGDDLGAAGYVIESPRFDAVRVRFDPARFDFRRLGVRFVLLPSSEADRLAANASVARVTTIRADAPYALFHVQP